MGKYKLYKLNGITFRFKRELNPLTKELDYHIWIRHLVEPETLIKAFFAISE